MKGKEEGGTGFSKGWQGCLEGFPEGRRPEGNPEGQPCQPEGNPERQPCQPEENPVPPDSFPFTNIVYNIEVIFNYR